MDTAQLGAALLMVLQERGWKIQRRTSSDPLLPPPLLQRYPGVPAEVTGFLEALESCTNAEEDVWFLCAEDFRRTDHRAFRWNEFELMSLDTREDAEYRTQIRGFWDLHFPFMLAVHSDYDYLAVSLHERSYGEIVHGGGPGFEETTVVAPTFAHFLTSLHETAAGRRDQYPLSFFV